jgi:XLF-Cernunnos, XRcc4-like factor, NHEJ component
MPSALKTGWRKLPVEIRPNVASPTLFFNFSRHVGGLKLQVTDLAHIWTAVKTSKQELKEEAARTRSSIDPSEDDEQYEALLGKLEESVSGEDGASVQVTGDARASAPVRFDMETSIPLPKPLGTLEWTFCMAREEASVLTQELIIPALRVIDLSRRREEDLRRRIKEKDHVIGRLMDKFEGSGMDLSMVFPGFAGARKGLDARQAAKVVPGIEAFREGEWEESLRGGHDGGWEEVVDELKDPATGQLTWRRPTASMSKCNSQQGEERWKPFTKMTTEHEVTSII